MKHTRKLLAAFLLAAMMLTLPVLALEPGTATVKADALRFRAGPSLDSEILDLVYDGSVVEVLEDLGEWCRVRWNGQEGYMSSQYLVQATVTQPEPSAQPEAPAEPEPSAQPENPSEPEPSAQPETPSEPEPSAQPETPAEPEPSAQPETPAEPEPSAQPETPAKEETFPCTGVLTGDAVRFRAGPGLDQEVLGYFFCGNQVSVLAREGDWYQVQSGGTTGYLFAEYVETMAPGETPAVSGDLAKSVISLAKENLGVPYVYGGTSPEGFDCSGLVYYCFLKSGVKLNRTATGQYQQGSYVEKSALQPGDLVFFVSPGTRSIGHVGIYIGDNEFIHASTGSRKIMVSDLTSSYYVTNYYGARRITG